MNWIESKALFANESLHKRYSEDQLQSYYNRYIKHILYVCTIIMMCCLHHTTWRQACVYIECHIIII